MSVGWGNRNGKFYYKNGMREKIERMYASGELERILRYCKVKEEDIPDLLQEVSL